ncbi:hypothetical protein EXIGLDRAFT_458541 [Exidia glandulosa HHB12029]|uniref:CCHC-type domain-containing protein n=1 Tax=Exidia glandulosa HHB12029 TaxID=1314781 RepID=A0A165PPJ9_EXIGL|nr:hypothetical protein EXIGLDRAFT_458541 [Exidia glandulosa HHB12029]
MLQAISTALFAGSRLHLRSPIPLPLPIPIRTLHTTPLLSNKRPAGNRPASKTHIQITSRPKSYQAFFGWPLDPRYKKAVCKHCQTVGHEKRHCPHRKEGVPFYNKMGGGKPVCTKCGEKGHTWMICGRWCEVCGVWGHNVSTCWKGDNPNIDAADRAKITSVPAPAQLRYPDDGRLVWRKTPQPDALDRAGNEGQAATALKKPDER